MTTKFFDYEKAIRMMVKIRVVERFIRDAFWDEKIFSFLHLSFGQEAVAVGVNMALDQHDIMLGNHRSHGHYLAKGGNLESMVYEIFGDERGCCKGFGGSMHMLDRSVGFTGSTPILGSVAPIAVGQAFANRISNQEVVTVVFVGDGAAEEGVFMESVNLAANKKCKIIFVIEDNKYAVNSNHLHRKSESYSHEKVFKGLGAQYLYAKTQNVSEIEEVTSEARKAAERTGPVVLHLVTQRLHSHSGPILESDTLSYRGLDTIESRQELDCIKVSKEAAALQDHSKSEIESWEITETSQTLAELNSIKETIKVRSLD